MTPSFVSFVLLLAASACSRTAWGVRARHTRHAPHGSGSAPLTMLPLYPSGPKSSTPKSPGNPLESGAPSRASSRRVLSSAPSSPGVRSFAHPSARASFNAGVATAVVSAERRASSASARVAAAAASRFSRALSRRLRFFFSSAARRRRQVRPQTRASAHARSNVALYLLTLCAMRFSNTSPRNSKSRNDETGSHMYVRSPKNTTSLCVSLVAPFGCFIRSAASGITSLCSLRSSEMPGQSVWSVPLPCFQGAHTGVPTMNGSS